MVRSPGRCYSTLTRSPTSCTVFLRDSWVTPPIAGIGGKRRFESTGGIFSRKSVFSPYIRRNSYHPVRQHTLEPSCQRLAPQVQATFHNKRRESRCAPDPRETYVMHQTARRRAKRASVVSVKETHRRTSVESARQKRIVRATSWRRIKGVFETA